jgi:hypothetical protein
VLVGAAHAAPLPVALSDTTQPEESPQPQTTALSGYDGDAYKAHIAPAAKLVVLGVFTLILVTELSPVLAKAVSKPGPYEILLGLHEDEANTLRDRFKEAIDNPFGTLGPDYETKRNERIRNYRSDFDEMVLDKKWEVDQEVINIAVDQAEKDPDAIYRIWHELDRIGDADAGLRAVNRKA